MCGLLFLGCTYFTQIEGGDPGGQKRPGAPGKRYKSMGEAKMGVHTALKCRVCGLKGHTSRSSKCPVRNQKKVNDNERQSSCITDFDATKMIRKTLAKDKSGSGDAVFPNPKRNPKPP
jgi:hypothetical protein